MLCKDMLDNIAYHSQNTVSILALHLTCSDYYRLYIDNGLCVKKKDIYNSPEYWPYFRLSEEGFYKYQKAMSHVQYYNQNPSLFLIHRPSTDFKNLSFHIQTIQDNLALLAANPDIEVAKWVCSLLGGESTRFFITMLMLNSKMSFATDTFILERLINTTADWHGPVHTSPFNGYNLCNWFNDLPKGSFANHTFEFWQDLQNSKYTLLTEGDTLKAMFYFASFDVFVKHESLEYLEFTKEILPIKAIHMAEKLEYLWAKTGTVYLDVLKKYIDYETYYTSWNQITETVLCGESIVALYVKNGHYDRSHYEYALVNKTPRMILMFLSFPELHFAKFLPTDFALILKHKEDGCLKKKILSLDCLYGYLSRSGELDNYVKNYPLINDYINTLVIKDGKIQMCNDYWCRQSWIDDTTFAWLKERGFKCSFDTDTTLPLLERDQKEKVYTTLCSFYRSTAKRGHMRQGQLILKSLKRKRGD